MILDLVYTSKDLYIFNQVRFRLTHLLLSLNITGLYTRNLCYPINASTFTESTIKLVVFDKTNVRIKEKI